MGSNEVISRVKNILLSGFMISKKKKLAHIVANCKRVWVSTKLRREARGGSSLCRRAWKKVDSVISDKNSF
jgi:hypothetical protein